MNNTDRHANTDSRAVPALSPGESIVVHDAAFARLENLSVSDLPIVGRLFKRHPVPEGTEFVRIQLQRPEHDNYVEG